MRSARALIARSPRSPLKNSRRARGRLDPRSLEIQRAAWIEERLEDMGL